MRGLRKLQFSVATIVSSALIPCLVVADDHTGGVPLLSSRPDAPYTFYLNFAGFNYTGNWSSGTPGSTPSYFGVSSTGTFNSTQQNRIKQVWARVAEKYAPFNVNVTTIDPAVAAGRADTDAHRQAYYDSQARMMHTVIGGTGGWSGGGGVSFVGTTQNSYSTSGNGGAGLGRHTNWVFAAQAPTSYQFVAEASAHEIGHGMKLDHQSDFNGTAKINEYSSNNGATGNGSYAPIMGNSYSTQRGTWRIGTAGDNGNPVSQNDVATLLSNNGVGGFIDDGIGHGFGTATDLPLTGLTINNTLAKGVIVPSSSANPQAMGEDSYLSDFFRFRTEGGLVSMKLTNGSQYLTPGTADPGATLDSVLRVYDSSMNLVGMATRDGSTLFSTFSMNLGVGNYFAKISSIGGYSSTFATPASYYTMGSYFLTGSGFTPVPEPATMLGLASGLAFFYRRRRNQK